MVFNGFLKLTLLDFPTKTACTVFTAGCNFRCPFCHNASLAENERLCEHHPEEEILAYLEKRRGIIDGVCITGGEPLLHKDLPDFMRKVKSAGFLTKLDTNGSFPDRLEIILKEGLADYVAMDIKASEERYAEAAGLEKLDTDAIKKSIALLNRSGVEQEFRTTAVKGIHTPEEISKICRMISGADKYYIQNFKDSGDLIDERSEGLSKIEMDALLSEAQKYIPDAALRGI